MRAVLQIDDRLAGEGRRSATLTRDGQLVSQLTFENLRGALSSAAGADPFVLGAVMPQMAEGLDVHVEGQVSRALLRNLADFQEFWQCWRPDRYRAGAITADEVLEAVPNTSGKVMSAFSGGVDGSFTAHRHLFDEERIRPSLDAVILVHGADIGDEDDATFGRVLKGVEEMLGETGVEVLAVKTNFRQNFGDWEDGHGAAIASCMALFQPEYSQGLIGSTEDVASLVLPWGSTPVTDHLLSTGQLAVRNDGAGFSRTAKVAALSAWPAARDRLRVCWQGEQLDRNCGQCEKCQRTLLNFRAIGVDAPACMPPDAGTSRVTLRNNVQVTEWRSIAAYARAHGRPEVAAEAEATLRRNAARIWLGDHPGAKTALRRLAKTVRRR